jgi:hypothetical protein
MHIVCYLFFHVTYSCHQYLSDDAIGFTEALAQTSPSDLYYYSLPLGTPIPGTTTSSDGGGLRTSTSTSSTSTPATTFAPSCSGCVSSLMAIFAPYASDSSYLLGLTYPPAASAANKQCGDGYAPGPETVVASPTPPVPLAPSNSKAGGALSNRIILGWRQRPGGQYTTLVTGAVLAFATIIFTLAGTVSLFL